MPDGYRALRENAAWFDLSTRGKLRVTGEDRARLLHAMSTNHIQQLTPGQGCYAFFLNAQGRIQADAHVLCFEDHFLLDTEPETAQKLCEHIDRFIIADDVTLENATAELATIAIEGPDSGAVLHALGAPLPEADFSTTAWEGKIVAKLSASGAPGYWLILPQAEREALLAQLKIAHAETSDVHTVRLEHGKPRYGEDIFDTTIPQESRQLHAIHFSKGCYLGQEIVERVRSRGHVNKLLCHVRIESTQACAAGAKIMAAEKEAGEITSAAFSPAAGTVFALAYMRAEFVRPGAALTLDGNSVALLATA
jgi:tRNA-modifying protein YgfZ